MCIRNGTMRAAALVLIAMTLSACSVAGARPTGEAAVPYPQGCAAFDLSPRRCEAVLRWVLQQAHAEATSIASVELLGDPGCGADNSDPRILCKRTTSFVVRMRVHFVDGGVVEESKFCSIEANYSYLCTENPEIRLGGPTFGGGGYWDTTGDTPPPLDPAAVAAAKPLHVDKLDIPIDHVGHYEIPAGRATLAMGILRGSSFTVADLHPTNFVTTEDGVTLQLVSTTPGAKPFFNLYDHGWHAGTEDVDVRLVFDIVRFDPGATLGVRALVVE
jgi:hypothetical protein